ncbi:MAG: hypothetical protein IK997_02995 [Bacilli bacterium]|nr:hypothetical protein [Bacilli bacterium]
MNKITNEELEKINGGTSTFTSTIINAVTNLFKLFYEVGEGVGSGFRRVKENELCPLE